MSQHHEQTIYVYENWRTSVPMLMGRMYVSSVRGQESIAFEYDAQWLSGNEGRFLLDPDLSFYRGRQYTPLDKRMFGLLADSCPDRWGRLLMNRKEAIAARKESRKPHRLTECDYLLGVFDEARMGALRFSTEEGGPFLSCDPSYATPPWVSLRTLEHASLAFEQDDNGLEEKWLNQLLAPGSSLGGARPKAAVQDEEGALWIAKFPSRHDEYNSGAWEKVVHDLARLCGLNVPESRLEAFSSGGGTFIVKRFDRNGRQRVHFASAMTLLGRTDGTSGEDGAGYLDLASFLRSYGAQPGKDLAELWRRIVFNMAVSNTDDHLRNHGFLLTKNGWRLSPLYDVNPVPYGNRLSLNVSEYDSAIDFDLAEESAQYFGISPKTAAEEIAAIRETVRQNWRILAANCGLSRSAMDYMQPAFSLTEM